MAWRTMTKWMAGQDPLGDRAFAHMVRGAHGMGRRRWGGGGATVAAARYNHNNHHSTRHTSIFSKQQGRSKNAGLSQTDPEQNKKKGKREDPQEAKRSKG